MLPPLIFLLCSKYLISILRILNLLLLPIQSCRLLLLFLSLYHLRKSGQSSDQPKTEIWRLLPIESPSSPLHGHLPNVSHLFSSGSLLEHRPSQPLSGWLYFPLVCVSLSSSSIYHPQHCSSFHSKTKVWLFPYLKLAMVP